MEICLMEANKKVKALNEKLDNLLKEEQNFCQTVYRKEEEKIVYDYDFFETRRNVQKINREILELKNQINQKNNETKIGIEDYTISDALIEIALIRKELESYLLFMNQKEKITTRVDNRNDSVMYMELLYDPRDLKEYIANQKEKLANIQISIDRANLNTFIEY